MTRMGLPVSTSQAIVGAILGWNFYTNNPTDLNILIKIVTTWVSGPILGGVFAVLMFILVKKINKRTKIHLLYRDSYIRFGLLLVGAFGAYSLGANNIANVMGVFTTAVHLPAIDLGFIRLDSTQQLFFIGGVAIAVGIITYSKHVMETVGNTLMPITPDAAIVVVLSQALVLFIFSSQSLSSALQSIGLPPIPLVPVSSSQVVIGSIIGIGLYKGGKEIKYNVLGSISLGWIATPLVAGVVAFFMLFFVNNVFKKDVGENVGIKENIEIVQDSTTSDHLLILNDTLENPAENLGENVSGNKVYKNSTHPISYSWFVSMVLLLIIVILIYYLTLRKRKINLLEREIGRAEEKYRMKLQELEKKYADKMHHQLDMGKELKFRQNEMVTMAMSIIHKNEFLSGLKEEIVKIKMGVKDPETRMGLNKLSLMITQDLSIDRDREKFQMHISEQNSSFIHRLTEAFPTMTDNEKRLASLLRLNLSSKEIASILNISPKSVEMNRYRMRKKLKVDPKVTLSDFIRNF
jgi:phosphate/sulfate permease